jgi:hypothetical protein
MVKTARFSKTGTQFMKPLNWQDLIAGETGQPGDWRRIEKIWLNPPKEHVRGCEDLKLAA